MKPTRKVDPVLSAKVKAAKFTEKQRRTMFRVLCEQRGVPVPEVEWRYSPDSPRSAVDFVWHPEKICLESHGGLWTHGGHVRGVQFLRDRAKSHTVQMMGYLMLEVDSSRLCTTETLQLIRRAIASRRV